jgi:hypothetical protein
MKCPECGTTNNTDAKWCKFCGEQLGQRKQKTLVEHSSSQQPAADAGNAGTKRRTLYEPPPQGGGDAHQAARGGRDPTVKLPPPASDDFFDRPQVQRQPLNSEDPWAHIADSNHAHRTPQDNTPPKPRKKGTVIDHGPSRPAPAAVQGTIRGALFIETRSGVQVVPLLEGRSTVGRDDDRDVVIHDERTSGQHGFINVEGEHAIFMDASTNGSKVDGEVVKFGPATIQHGSVIVTGSARIVVAILPPGLLP